MQTNYSFFSKNFFLVLILSTFFGCGSDTDLDTDVVPETIIKTGYFIDSAVEGVSYNSDQGDIGITDRDGKFNYTLGSTITFSIAGIELGNISDINSDNKILIQDIVGVNRSDTANEEVLKIARFLQSLDNDKNPSNGIEITQDTRDTLENTNRSISNMNIIQVEELVAISIGKTFVTQDNALSHLDIVLETINSDDNLELTAKESSVEIIEENSVEIVEESSVEIVKEIINEIPQEIITNQYQWSVDGNIVSKEKTYSTADLEAGNHTLKLEVMSRGELIYSDSKILNVTEYFAPIIKTNFPNTTYHSLLGNNILFDASQSIDSDGNIVSYEWSEANMILSREKIFSINNLSLGIHTITLSIIDNDSQTTTENITIEIVNYVNSYVQEVNNTPTANAGIDQTMMEGSSITLDASLSTDFENDTLTYAWLENGSFLSNSKIFTKSDFTVGFHLITLMVTDNVGGSSTNTVGVTISKPDIDTTVKPLTEPIADAGADSIVYYNDNAVFDASSSADYDDSIVSYIWSENAEILSTDKIFSKNDFSMGIHTITLTVTDESGLIDTDEVIVTVAGPIANAGADRTVNVGDTVTLDSLGSFGNNNKYTWTSSTYDLRGLESSPTFTMNSPGIHNFTLTATAKDPIIDTNSKPIYPSDEDIVTITVLDDSGLNIDAILDTVSRSTTYIRPENSNEDELVISIRVTEYNVSLDASQSYDSDGTIVKYEWFQYNDISAQQELVGTGSNISVTLNDPKCILKITDNDGNFVEMFVKESIGTTLNDFIFVSSVQVSISDIKNMEPTSLGIDSSYTRDDDSNQKASDIGGVKTIFGQLALDLSDPVAKAGTNKIIGEGESAILDASSSTDLDGFIESYSWSEGSILGTGINPVINGLSAGIHNILLTVTDNDGNTHEDNIIITVNAKPSTAPSSDAGSDQIVTQGESIYLSGVNSLDADNDIVSYKWSEGTNTLSYSRDTVLNNLSVGDHIITLTVIDGVGNIATDSVAITINQAPNIVPISNAGKDLVVTVNNTFTLNASGSSDIDGSIVKYEWFEEDGSLLSNKESPSLTMSSIGEYTLRLRVTDDRGDTNTDELALSVTDVSTHSSIKGDNLVFDIFNSNENDIFTILIND